MDDKELLLSNIDKIHTTKLGIGRIRKNLGLNNNVVKYCKEKLLHYDSRIFKKGKNWYCEIDHVKITINANSYTIITAHPLRKEKC